MSAGVLDVSDGLPFGTRPPHGIAVINRSATFRLRRAVCHGLDQGLTGSYTGGLLSLAAAGFIAMIIVLIVDHDHSLERVSGEDARRSGGNGPNIDARS